MQIRNMFVSEDGQAFATLEECRKHELESVFINAETDGIPPTSGKALVAFIFTNWPELKAIVEGKPRSRRPRSDKGTKRVKEVA